MSAAHDPFAARPAAVPQAPHPLWGTLRAALPARAFWGTAFAVWAAVLLFVGGLMTWKGRTEKLADVTGVLSLVGLFIVMAIGWILFASRVVQLNTPEAARLVPGQPRALRRLLVVVAAALCAVGVVASRGLLGVFDMSPWPVAWVVSVSLAMFAMTLWSARHPVFWIIVWPLFSLGFGSPAMKRLWNEGVAVAAGPMGLAMVVGLGVLMALAIHHVILEGGERHLRQQQRTRRWEAASRGTPQVNAGREDAQGGWFTPAMWSAPAARLYDRWLERLTAVGTRGSASARAMLCFGPSLHPLSAFGQAFWLVLGSLIFVGGRWVWRELSGGPQQGKDALLAGLAMGVAVGSSFALMGLAIHMRHIVWRTRTEQALMSLAPGVPRGPVLSRRVALHVGAIVLTWALILSLPALALWLSEEAGRLRAAATKADFSLMVWVPMLWAFVPDWSRLKDPTGRIWPLVASAMALFALAMGVGIAGGVWRERADLLGVLIGVAGLAWRWWRMGREPAALPVGRRA